MPPSGFSDKAAAESARAGGREPPFFLARRLGHNSSLARSARSRPPLADSSADESSLRATKRTKPAAVQVLCLFCAPARTRTWNDSSEDCCDIHFTTGASLTLK